MRGGARVNSGPPPDPNALRRDRPTDKDGWTSLPANGPASGAPEWPLRDDVRMVVRAQAATELIARLEAKLEATANARSRTRFENLLADAREVHALAQVQLEQTRHDEAAVWTEVWSTPQANAWVRLGWAREVAQYVRWKVRGEQGDIRAGSEARQWSDRLGLNPAAMLRLRWRVAPDEVAARRTEQKPAGKAAGARGDVRQRLRSVNGGA